MAERLTLAALRDIYAREGARSQAQAEERAAEFDTMLAKHDLELTRPAREYLEAALEESDADERDPNGGSGWDVEVDALTVLELLGGRLPDDVVPGGAS